MSSRRTLPPGPTRPPFLGSLSALSRDPLAFVMEMSRAYGSIAYTNIGAARMFMISDPALIDEALVGRYKECIKDIGTQELVPLVGRGLLTSEGETWKRQRKLASPPLSPKRIAGYADAMVECTDRMCAGLVDGEARDVHVDMMRLTLEIVGKTLLGFDPRGDADRISHILDVSMAYFDKQLRTWQGLLPKVIPTPDRIAFRKVLAELDALVYGIIERCRKSDVEAEHLLARLVNARDENGEAMSDAQLRDEAVTMLLAGHETTALTLSFAVLLLSEHPEAAKRLREELSGKLGDRKMTLADVPALPYLDAVVRETLRLYPPAWVVGRQIAQAFELGGYMLKPGDQILMSPYAMQRDPRYFKEPSKFMPERWLDPGIADIPRFAYFPFGGGQRVCIGNHFATMELQIVLGTLLRQVELTALPDFKLVLDPVVTLRPKTGVQMRVHRLDAPGSERAA